MVRGLLVVGVVIVAAIGLHVAGVAGYRRGLVLVAFPLVLGSGAGTAWALDVRPTRREDRWPWIIAAVALGLVATAALGARAPMSHGALAAELDALQLPFFDVATEDRMGHSWCRPTCPVVERRYDVPDTGVQATMITAAVALAERGLLADEELRKIDGTPELVVADERRHLTVRVLQDDGGAVTGVRIRAESKRP